MASWGDMLEEENYDGVMQLMHREFGINPNELFAPVENLRVVVSPDLLYIQSRTACILRRN